MKPSKRAIDLKSKQKMLVKQKQYLEADRLKSFIQKISEKDRQ